jgi:rhamnogalacturonyl hydrolase YesR
MQTLMEAQPNYPQQLYSVYSRAHGLHTVPDPGDEDKRYVMSRDATRDQFFFHPGIAGGFLARLYQATDEGEWLDLAKEYMRFAEGASDYLFRLQRAGKVGWAASVLYMLTGESKYREMAVRVGDNLIASQAPEGWWGPAGAPQPSTSSTGEMTSWLDEIHQAVG